MANLAYVCPDTDIVITPDGNGYEYPECTNHVGSWQYVVVEQPWDPSKLNSSELASAYGAGFVVMGSGMAVVYGAALVLRAILGK